MKATLNGHNLLPRETQRYFDKRDSANTLVHKIITSDFISYRLEDFIREKIGDSRNICCEEHANDNIYIASKADILGAIITYVPDNTFSEKTIQDCYRLSMISAEGHKRLLMSVEKLIEKIIDSLNIILDEAYNMDVELKITNINFNELQLSLDQVYREGNIVSHNYTFKFTFEKSTNKTYVDFYDEDGKFSFSSKDYDHSDEYILGLEMENAR